MYEGEVTFQPQFSLWIATNYRPQLPQDDDAVWRRVRELPFDQQVPEDKRDPTVRQRLTDPEQNGTAILAWAVEGLRLFYAEGLEPPEKVQAATKAYREEMDECGEFFSSCCTFGPDKTAKAGLLRGEYEAWCYDNSERPVDGKAFGARLRAAGCAPGKSGGVRTWAGVGLLAHEDRES